MLFFWFMSAMILDGVQPTVCKSLDFGVVFFAMPRNEKKDSKKDKDQLWQREDGVCFWRVFVGHKSWKSPNLLPIQ